MLNSVRTRYLAISDVQTVGLRYKYAQDWTFGNHGLLTEIPEEKQPPPRPCGIHSTSPTIDGSYAVFKDPAADDSLLGFVSKFDAEGDDQGTSVYAEASAALVKPSNKRKRKAPTSPLGDISPNQMSAPEKRRGGNKPMADRDTVQNGLALQKKSKPDSLPKSMEFYNKNVSSHRKRCHEPAVAHGPLCYCAVCHPRGTSRAVTAKEPQPQPQPQPTTLLSQQALLALETGHPLKRLRTPLNFQPLSSVSGSRSRRNRSGDYLAVVSWVDNKTIKRPTMKLKRDLRIVDPSSDKAVLLSVFDDPLHFTPAVGTVALFRNLRMHEWDGGSLNAYEKYCAGYEWFVPNPVGVEGCDVEALREWWVERQEGEREVRRERGRVREVLGERKVAPVCHDGCVGQEDREMVRELDGMGFVGEGEGWDEIMLVGEGGGEKKVDHNS